MYFQDLSRYQYNQQRPDCAAALNVGWLDASKPYESGVASPSFVEKLERLIRNPVNLTRGSHACNFCVADVQFNSPEEMDGRAIIQKLRELGGLGNGEIVVMGPNSKCYYAPVLILHYIRRHKYLPPAEFVNAVIHTSSSRENLP